MDSNNEVQKNDIENRTCHYFDDIIKFEGFDLDNTLIDQKSGESILVCNISYKKLIDAEPLRIKTDGVIEFMMELDI